MRKQIINIVAIAMMLTIVAQTSGQGKKEKSKFDEKVVAQLQGAWQGDLEKTKKLLADVEDISERQVERMEKLVGSLAIQFNKNNVGYVAEPERDINKVDYKIIETKSKDMLSVAIVEFKLAGQDDGGTMEFVFVDKDTVRVTVKIERSERQAPTLVFTRKSKLDLASKYKKSDRAKGKNKDSKKRAEKRDK